jgi:hypothetical protein
MTTRLALFSPQQLIKLAGVSMTNQETALFVNSYHALYYNREAGLSATNYDLLETQYHQPSAIVSECYKKFQ